MKETLFIIWMLLTVGLTLSVIGLLLFIPDIGPSTWMRIGLKLLDSITEKTNEN